MAVLPERQQSERKVLGKQQSSWHHVNEHAAAQLLGDLQGGLRCRALRPESPDGDCMRKAAIQAGAEEVERVAQSASGLD